MYKILICGNIIKITSGEGGEREWAKLSIY